MGFISKNVYYQIGTSIKDMGKFVLHLKVVQFEPINLQTTDSDYREDVNLF